MESNKTVTPSVTSVSISLSRKEQGALYMKSLRQAERIKELKASNDDLANALRRAKEALYNADYQELTHGELMGLINDALSSAGAL